MRNLLKLSFAIVLVTAFSCSSDDTPPVIPTVTFEQDRSIVETGIDVTYTTTAVDAESYLWDFGDGSSSTDASPVHSFSEIGNFTVTVTVTSTTGDTATSSATTTVGTRYIRGFLVTAYNPVQPDGKPWDDDGSAPELLFSFRQSSTTTSLFYPLGDNVSAESLPVGGTLPDADQVELTNEDHDFILLDNDEPLDELSSDELMVLLQENPITVTPDEIDYNTGEGRFTVEGFEFTFVIFFDIRNQ